LKLHEGRDIVSFAYSYVINASNSTEPIIRIQEIFVMWVCMKFQKSKQEYGKQFFCQVRL
jgi:hypothetical protein